MMVWNIKYSMRILSVCVLTILGAIIMVGNAEADSIEASPSSVIYANSPIITPFKVLDLSYVGRKSDVLKLKYSNSGNYLAVMIESSLMRTDIVVWDLVNDKEQTHIRCPLAYDPGLFNLIWSFDDKVISFGVKHQWNSMTGEELPDSPAIGIGAILNKDKSKMLTLVGYIGGPTTIHIYNTSDWTLQKLYIGGFSVETAVWTSEDKILAGVTNSAETYGKIIDGRMNERRPDVALKLIDPTGKTPTQSIWYLAIPDNRPHYFPWKQLVDVHLGAVSYVSNKIKLGEGRIIDGKTMNIVSFFNDDDMLNNKVAMGTGGAVFSNDGNILFLKQASAINGRKSSVNTVIDANNGSVIGSFIGGNSGIDVSPDGKWICVGDYNSVRIFNLK